MALDVCYINKIIGKQKVLKNIKFSVNSNEIVALVGPNGVGKTSLFNSIMQLNDVDSGEIYLFDQLLNKKEIGTLGKMFFMQDSSTLYPDLSGYNHMRFIANIHRTPNKFVEEVIDELDIRTYLHKKIRTYSTGMKQRVLMGMAIISRVPLLILDEPMNGLDPTGSQMLRKKMQELRDQGTTILFSSHILSDIDKVADRILFMDGGTIIKEQIMNNDEIAEIYYLLTINESYIKKAYDILKKQDFVLRIELINKNTVKVFMQQLKFSKLNQLLFEKGIELMDVSKHETDTELLYEELYGDGL